MAQANHRPDSGNNDRGRTERRWGLRTSLRIPAQLHSNLGEAISATVLNMSDEGLLVETSPGCLIATDTLYTLRIESYLNSQCLPIWRSGQLAGLAFSLPIHPAVVAALARRFPAIK